MKFNLLPNPFKNADAFGLLKPGGQFTKDFTNKLNARGLDKFTHFHNDIAPWIAAAVAGGYMLGPAMAGGAAGGSTTGGAGAGTLMPAAIPETAGTLQGWGMTQTAPGVWTGSGSAGAAKAGWWSRIPKQQPSLGNRNAYEPPQLRSEYAAVPDMQGYEEPAMSSGDQEAQYWYRRSQELKQMADQVAQRLPWQG